MPPPLLCRDKCICVSIVVTAPVFTVMALVNTMLLVVLLGWDGGGGELRLNLTETNYVFNVTGRVFLVGSGFAAAELMVFYCLAAIGMGIHWFVVARGWTHNNDDIDIILNELMQSPDRGGDPTSSSDGTQHLDENGVDTMQFDSDSEDVSLSS